MDWRRGGRRGPHQSRCSCSRSSHERRPADACFDSSSSMRDMARDGRGPRPVFVGAFCAAFCAAAAAAAATAN